MKPIEFENGIVQIDASIVAEGLGLAPSLLQEEMRAGRITSLAERGVDAGGRFRRFSSAEIGAQGRLMRLQAAVG